MLSQILLSQKNKKEILNLKKLKTKYLFLPTTKFFKNMKKLNK